MRLYEFQAKRLFAEVGIPVPKSTLLTSPEQVADLAFPVLLKAQVPIGGRGKAGGIKIARSRRQAETLAAELLGSDIRGYTVGALLAEAMTEIQREIYLAVLFDKGSNQVMIVGSARGGVDIEQVAREDPGKIVKKVLSPFLGMPQFAIRTVAKSLGINDIGQLGAILEAMHELLWTRDATLVEINPLAETPEGLLALDAKMTLDDKAAFRHATLFADLAREHKGLEQGKSTLAEQLAEERDITYVRLDGDVGLIADGAGTGMLTLDLIQDAGGRPANFCEMGGLANPEVMRQSIEVVLANPNVKALLITLIGGLTRMDEMAEGIVQYANNHKATVPIVIRMAGTQEAVGKATLKQAGYGTFDDLPAAVEAVVDLAKAGA
jgi:succinyl-CoA synthetase beta subunit